MLESFYIAKSKIRQELLALFFSNASEKYYLRQLQRMLGHSAGSIRRELLRFQKDSLFNTKSVGNLIYYSLNTKHPLFKELKSIVSKTVGVEGSLRQVLSSIPNIKFAFVYGSFASNKENASSDIDIMIIGNPPASYLNEKIAELEKKLKREINPAIYSLKQYKSNKISKRGFITELLKKPKIMLMGNKDEL